ncbi:MAG: hypothetical protein NT007_08965 [Candidatus Kapabacteria bacterium]|nr:hypothetical protein [Candidatus Kapabacteria bacterium]
MADKSYTRNYNMSDADLCMFTSNLISDMTRDHVELAVFGVTTPNITNLQALGNAFEVFPSDEMLQGDIMIATATKNEKATAVKDTIRALALRVELKWGISSGQYTRLGISDLSRLSDEMLLFTSRRVHTVMTGYLTDLTSGGLTSGMLDDFEDLNEEFELAKNDQHDKINLRDNKTVERVSNGNELYALVSKYCNIGKQVWLNVDPAKYNDYVIYGSTSVGLSKPQNLTANWTLPDTVVHLNWEAVTGALNYEIFSSAVNFGLPAGTYTSLGEFPSPPQGVSFVADKRNYYKIKAKNGSVASDYSDEAWTEVVISV